MNNWRDILTVIIGQEMDKVSLTKENEKVLKRQLEKQLNVLIDQVMERIRKSTYDSPQGQLKYGLIRGFINIREIKKGIPLYADAILDEIKKSETQKEIKGVIKEKIDFYLKRSFDTFDDTPRLNILKKTHSETVEEAKSKLNTLIDEKHRLIWNTPSCLCLSQS